MKAGKSISVAVKIIIAVVVFALLAGIVGLAHRLTNGFSTPIKNFYLQCGEQVITRDTELYVCLDKPLVIEPKYMLDKMNSATGYSYRIVAKESENTEFDYVVNGESYGFTAGNDFTDVFSVESSDTSLTLTNDFEADNPVYEVLRRYYNAAEITGSEISDYDEIPYFDLQIYSYDKSEMYTIGLLFPVNITGIELNIGNIRF